MVDIRCKHSWICVKKTFVISLGDLVQFNIVAERRVQNQIFSPIRWTHILLDKLMFMIYWSKIFIPFIENFNFQKLEVFTMSVWSTANIKNTLPFIRKKTQHSSYKPTSLSTTSQKMLVDKIKFVYSEKATKFCEISTLLLSAVHTDKSKVEISQNFVTFSEYMNFIKRIQGLCHLV